MRPRKALLVFGLAAVTGLSLLVIGCSGDSNSSNLTAGSLSDPNFVAVQNEVSNLIDSTVSYISLGLNNLLVLPGDTDVIIVSYGPTPGDSVSADYVYENGWHIVSWTGNFSGKTTSFKDSIQFLDNLGQPQQDNNSTETLIYKHRWVEITIDTTVSYTDYLGVVGLTLDNLGSGSATVNGSHSIDVSIKIVTVDSTVWRDISVEGTVSNLAIINVPGGWLQNCPLSGTIGATANMTYTKDSGNPVTSDWSFSIQFTDGFISVSAISGTTSWYYTGQVCIAPS